jgi:hypothetical protein
VGKLVGEPVGEGDGQGGTGVAATTSGAGEVEGSAELGMTDGVGE